MDQTNKLAEWQRNHQLVQHLSKSGYGSLPSAVTVHLNQRIPFLYHSIELYTHVEW